MERNVIRENGVITESGLKLGWDAVVIYVRGVIDEAVRDGEDEFPVMGEVLVKAGIATRPLLDEMEKQGHIKSVAVEVPSVLVPSKTVPAKAYYTERRIPKLVEEMLPKKQSFEAKSL